MADSPRTGRGSGRSGASPAAASSASRSAASSSPRPSLRASRSADFGLVSNGPGGPLSGSRSGLFAPRSIPAIHRAIRSRPASSGRSEPMCGIRSRPNLAMRKYRVLAYGSPGLMMRASGSAKSPRVGRMPTAFISATGDGELQPQRDRPAAVVGMAVAAVGVQVGPGPRLQRLARVGRVGEPSLAGGRGGVERRERLAVVAGPADEARLREGDELVPAVGPRAVQLLGQERQRVFRLVAVARHALAAAVELPDAIPLPVVAPPSRRRRRGPGRRRTGRPARRTCRRASPRRRSAAVASPAAGRPGRGSSSAPHPSGSACGSCARTPGRGSACRSRRGWRTTSPGKAAQCSAVAPSCHCRLFTANGITPAAGVWSLTEANKPVCDSVVGKSAFRAPRRRSARGCAACRRRGRGSRARRPGPRRRRRCAPTAARSPASPWCGRPRSGRPTGVASPSRRRRRRRAARGTSCRDRRRPPVTLQAIVCGSSISAGWIGVGPTWLRLDGLRPFHRRPAVVAALLDAMDRLPQLPADVADEQLAGLAIEAHPPGIAEAVRPDLRPGSLRRDEGVVLGDGVVLPLVLPVHVDPQDGREQVGDVLPRVERVGRVRVRRVARGDVEHAVGAEVEVPAVVAALQEGDDDLLARRVDPRRVGLGDPEPGHARAVRRDSAGGGPTPAGYSRRSTGGSARSPGGRPARTPPRPPSPPRAGGSS